MPGPDWRDLQRRGAARGAGGRGPRSGALPDARTPAPAPAPAEAPPLPSELQRLMSEREGLEEKMRALTGGARPDPRLAALYRVEPMASRRAEHEGWQAERERMRGAQAAGALGRRREEEERALARLDRSAASPPSEPPLPLPLRPTAAERDRLRFGGTPASAAGFMGARDRLRLGGRAPRDGERRLPNAAVDGAEAARALRESGGEAGREAADKLERVMARASTIRDAPARAERVIEDDWLRRRDRIGGPDLERYQRGMKERAARLFGVETGSLDDLQQRWEGLRDLSLGRRREARRQAERDDERRSRAVERRRDSADER